MMKAEKKARAMVASRSLPDLIRDFEVTNTIYPVTVELATVRGWIMDELQKRNESAFWAWVESDDDSPRGYYVM